MIPYSRILCINVIKKERKKRSEREAERERLVKFSNLLGLIKKVLEGLVKLTNKIGVNFCDLTGKVKTYSKNFVKNVKILIFPVCLGVEMVQMFDSAATGGE